MSGKQGRKEHIRTAAVQRKAERLDYIRQMLRELRDMTDAEDEQFIAYLIGMAYAATSDVIRERYANLIADVHPIGITDPARSHDQ